MKTPHSNYVAVQSLHTDSISCTMCSVFSYSPHTLTLISNVYLNIEPLSPLHLFVFLLLFYL